MWRTDENCTFAHDDDSERKQFFTNVITGHIKFVELEQKPKKLHKNKLA